jgi:predicted SnoaL-like aldol condensation-catalyzing enzyme
MMTADTLGSNAHQVMIDIFRHKDVTAVDRHFAESLIQHDPNIADGQDR